MNDNFVTLKELDEKLERLPTRFEVRFLILAGLLASRFIPVDDAAQAALSLLK